MAALAAMVLKVMICATWSEPYFCADVLDDLAAAVHAEVDIDIGHRDAFGVEEALEEELVLERIDVGDLHHVGDERSGGGTAARADRDVLLAGIADEIPDDHESSRETSWP